MVATAVGASGTEIVLPIPAPRLWSPSVPHLYGLRVSLAGGDAVGSYFAMRKVSLGKDAEGRTRILLNNRFVFQVGALDQGYWPDGLYTAPTDAALKLRHRRRLSGFGFNLLRKHAKVEPDRWYYWADTLGDPRLAGHAPGLRRRRQVQRPGQSGSGWPSWRSDDRRPFYNHPSIVVWTLVQRGLGPARHRRVDHCPGPATWTRRG